MKFVINQDSAQWDETLLKLPKAHILQTTEWAQVKAGNGWDAFYLTWSLDGTLIAAALLLERSLDLSVISFTVRMHYIPKGPVFKEQVSVAQLNAIENDLVKFSKSRKAFVLNMDPEIVVGKGIPDSENDVLNDFGEDFEGLLKTKGWFFADSQPQFKNSIFINLNSTEDELLKNMKQKTRYNIRLSGRKGVTVRVGNQEDFDMLSKMYAVTSQRDGFAIRDLKYYKNVWEIFFAQGMLKPLIAEVDGEPVAGLMLFVFGKTSWYIYGMSNGNHRNKMPTYLLQWEAIRISKEAGCEVYDLWGAPDLFDENDRMWGVFRFKQGLGGEVVRHIGNWELPLRPFIYILYTSVVPWLLKGMRLFGKRQTKSELVD